MKVFLTSLIIELILIAIASALLYSIWNDLASNYFHWKDLEFTQAFRITVLFRVLTIKIN